MTGTEDFQMHGTLNFQYIIFHCKLSIANLQHY